MRCVYPYLLAGFDWVELDFKAKTAEKNDNAVSKFSTITSLTTKDIIINTIIKTMLLIDFIDVWFISYDFFN
jgi:hypothetical protein